MLSVLSHVPWFHFISRSYCFARNYGRLLALYCRLPVCLWRSVLC